MRVALSGETWPGMLRRVCVLALFVGQPLGVRHVLMGLVPGTNRSQRVAKAQQERARPSRRYSFNNRGNSRNNARVPPL